MRVMGSGVRRVVVQKQKEPAVDGNSNEGEESEAEKEWTRKRASDKMKRVLWVKVGE